MEHFKQTFQESTVLSLTSEFLPLKYEFTIKIWIKT